MTLLIDSNVFLWWTTADTDRLGDGIVRHLASAPRVYLSLASVWELEIKRNSGRLELDAQIWRRLEEAGLTLLSADMDDVIAATSLPMIHRDPFDRMIVAQAKLRDLTLVTSDALLADYGIKILRV